MADADRDPPLHRVRHQACGINWRPTRFVDDVPYYHTCGLCRLIPKKTVLLPCSHVLCQSCHKGSIEEDGGDGGVCPLDQEPFQVSECARIKLSVTKVNSLKAYCWNQEHGCEYVGTLQDILTHCEEECSFHVVACPRCRENVLHADLPAHYAAGCGGESESSTEIDEPSEQDGEFASHDEGFSLEDLKAFLMELEVLDTDSQEQN